MKVKKSLTDLYNKYYNNDEKLFKKRKISALQSVEHMKSLLIKSAYSSVIDIGAGEGSVLEEISKTNITNDLHAVEISKSGINSINNKKIEKIKTVSQFDGYHIPMKDSEHELGLVIHVLEHVEHERKFLQEVSRVCNYLYIEVPLELNLKIENNIKLGINFGHLNYYNEHTFKNLLISSGLKLHKYKTYTASLNYERHISGFLKGSIKYYIKSKFLKFAPKLAQNIFVFIGGAFCEVVKKK